MLDFQGNCCDLQSQSVGAEPHKQVLILHQALFVHLLHSI